ncbi:MAG TPA: radical SAM family heme chaperone HemW [Candidatus Binatia bacterium]|jgi:oxygen-independent coproporphyrinogen-3 oxidase|nr:radical SAM family heme chaperone HemW [Candidatus Binatia bacterium]
MMSVPESFSLYIHIPFCVSKCPYCDFNSHVVSRIPEEEYTAALLKEMEFYALAEDWHDRGLKSIFFGGGTPSTFAPKSIDRILTKVESLYLFEREIEITLEANPGTVDRERFSGYRSCGTNRISVGAQSFQPRLLGFLGRTHTAEETRQALKEVRRAGFENFNLDLIYAVPGQSLSDLKKDLEEATGFRPPHLSAYNLTIEEGTPFHKEFRAGRMQSLAEEEELSMAEMVEELLAEVGLERYEISNYAKPGYSSLHNLNYWQGGDYLGIGAGAHSYKRRRNGEVFGRRWHNEKSPSGYIERIRRSGQALVAEENTDLKTAAGEFMFLGLRMKQGILVETFSALFGKQPIDFYPEIFRFEEEGFVEESGGRIRLTPRGLMVANSIFVTFV